MKWDWSEIKTSGDVMNALEQCQTKFEALQFMNEYKQVNTFAYENVRYMLGYYGGDFEERIKRWIF